DLGVREMVEWDGGERDGAALVEIDARRPVPGLQGCEHGLDGLSERRRSVAAGDGAHGRVGLAGGAVDRLPRHLRAEPGQMSHEQRSQLLVRRGWAQQVVEGAGRLVPCVEDGYTRPRWYVGSALHV